MTNKIKVPLSVLHDPTLSLKATGLYSFLCGCENGTTLQEIIKHGKDSRHSVLAGLQELKFAKLIVNTGQGSSIELSVECLLKDNNIKHQREVCFVDCRDIRPLRFDFEIFRPNGSSFLLELDGQCHFNEGFGDLSGIKHRDTIKDDYCKAHHIDLLRIPYWKFNQIKTTILNKINNPS